MSTVVVVGETREQFVAPDGNWRVVVTDEHGRLITFPVIFWRFTTDVRDRKNVARIEPMVYMANGISVAWDYECYLGVLGPDEDIERYRDAAVETAEAVFETSPLEMLAGAGEE